MLERFKDYTQIKKRKIWSQIYEMLKKIAWKMRKLSKVISIWRNLFKTLKLILSLVSVVWCSNPKSNTWNYLDICWGSTLEPYSSSMRIGSPEGKFTVVVVTLGDVRSTNIVAFHVSCVACKVKFIYKFPKCYISIKG